MPWKPTNKQEQRFELIREMEGRNANVTALCLKFNISRQTAYKWRRRFLSKRLGGLVDLSRRPWRSPHKTSDLWLRRLKRLRKRRPTWGVHKLRHTLRMTFGDGDLPSWATLGRWLKHWGIVAKRTPRRTGPVVLKRYAPVARYCHHIWTVDFKGWYRTGNGTRVDPLTVRNLYSRYGLAVCLLHSQNVAQTRKVFERLFRKYGLPARIRCDNGTPFGGGGPTRLTRLSAWWIKLGIAVDFIRPGRPCDNGAHEQFHRVYKAEAAVHPEYHVAAQQRRTDKWLRCYNHERPHAGLNLRVPAQLFRKNIRTKPPKPAPWSYHKDWPRRWVKGNGEISWRGVRRYVGEAFVGDYVALKPGGKQRWLVYFGPVLIGQLNEQEQGNIRMARYRLRR
jgi:putative transposase